VLEGMSEPSTSLLDPSTMRFSRVVEGMEPQFETSTNFFFDLLFSQKILVKFCKIAFHPSTARGFWGILALKGWRGAKFKDRGVPPRFEAMALPNPSMNESAFLRQDPKKRPGAPGLWFRLSM
jgi:hypothetical protein